MTSNDAERITEATDLEVVNQSAIHALERAAIDTQVATAHQFPRSLTKFRQRAEQLATQDLETAESCLYSRPVGKEKDENGVWREKIASGESIRMAEIVAASYGNLRVSSMIVEINPRFVRAEGVAWDLEANYAGKSQIVEATVKSDGTPYSERQRALVAKVATAKAYRDAVFKVVPKALIKNVTDMCKKAIAGKHGTMEERMQRVQRWLKSIDVSDDDVFAVLGIAGWSDITQNHLDTLTGLKTAISDGEPVRSIFPPAGTKTVTVPKAQAPSGPAPTKKPKGKETAKQPSPPESTSAPEKATADKSQPKASASEGPAQEDANATAAEQEPAADGATEGQGDAADEQTTAEEASTSVDVQNPVPPTHDDPMEEAKLRAAMLKELCVASNVSEAKVLDYLVAMKIAKPGQSFMGLSRAKLGTLIKGWPKLMEDVGASKE